MSRKSLGALFFISFVFISLTYDLMVSELNLPFIPLDYNQTDNGVGSLRSIINCAGEGDIIRFASNIDSEFLNIQLHIFKNISLKNETENVVVIKANFSISGFLNATYGINIAPNVNTFMQNVKLSHFNNSMNQPTLKNSGNLVLSDWEILGNTQSVVQNEGDQLKVVHKIVLG